MSVSLGSRTSKTANSLVTGAGKVFMDLDILSVITSTSANYKTDVLPFLQTNIDKEFSGTRGGNTFTRDLETRDLEIDGDDPYEQEITSNSGTLAMTLVDITQKVLKSTAPMERDPVNGALIPSRTMLDEHYHSLTLIAGMVGEKGWQIIHIPRTTGAESVAQEFAERGESTLPATFVARRDRDVTGQSLPPYYIWTFDADGDMELDDPGESGVAGAAYSAQLKAATENLATAQKGVNAVNKQIAAANAQAVADAALNAADPPKSGRSSGSKYSTATEG